jgi:hypothetical protein
MLERMRRLAFVLAIACGSPAPIDAGMDASRPDAGTRDAGPRDAGSQDAGSISLEPCALDDVFTTEALDVSEPLSEGYVVPSNPRLDALGRSIDRAIDGDLDAALAAASEASYEICEDGELLIWRPTDVTGQARVAWRRSAERALILEAPHPFHDRGTLEEARDLFDALGARVLVGSGTHRCANAAPGCEGTSSACGDPPGYRVSDAAHNVVATFQRAHERFSARFEDDAVVSVHGMADAGASLSDGTDDAVASSSHVARLAAALVLEGLNDITSCNSGAGVPVAARLCGTTNTQGRHLNGSPEACNTGASAASGRFVHFEQSPEVRASYAGVLAAFEATF